MKQKWIGTLGRLLRLQGRPTYETLWKLPIPAAAILGSVKFEMLLGHEVGLSFEYEEEDGAVSMRLVLEGVEAYTCTYLYASPEDILSAYDKLVDCGESAWLTVIRKRLAKYGDSTRLRHMMIYIDDQPTYEFICRGFRADVLGRRSLSEQASHE